MRSPIPSCLALLLLSAACKDQAPADTGQPADTALSGDGLVYLSATDRLARVAMALKGTRPSLQELAAVQADPDAIADIVDTYLASPLFGDTVRDLENQTLLVRIERDVTLDDPMEGISGEMLGAIVFEEPLKLIEHVVMNDLPYTDIVTMDQTLTTAHGARVWAGLADTWDPAGDAWQLTTYTDGRPAAGVLSTSPWNARFASNLPNAHREGAAAAAAAMLCTDYSSRDIELGSVDLTDDDAISQAILTNPACVSCHQTMDPLAGYFWGFGLGGIGDNFPSADWSPDNAGRGERATGRANGYFGLGGDTMTDMGQLMAQDSRFSSCAARRYISWLSQVPLDDVPIDAVVRAQTALVDSGMSVKEMTRAIVLHPEFARSHSTDPEQAEALVGLLHTRPEQLARLMRDLTGFEWQTEVTRRRQISLVTLATNSARGFKVHGGGIDSRVKLAPAYGYSAPASSFLRGFAAEAAGHVVDTDLAAPTQSRLLLTDVQADTTDESTVRSQLVSLHWRLLVEAVDADSTQVDESYALFADALALSGDPTTAWKLVLTALLQDFRIAYH